MAVLGVLGIISVVEDSNAGRVWGFVAFVGFAVWSLATSFLLLRDPTPL